MIYADLKPREALAHVSNIGSKFLKIGLDVLAIILEFCNFSKQNIGRATGIAGRGPYAGIR